MSETTIKRLVASGLLKKEQIVAYAPWEIRRTDLDSDPVRSVIERLQATGKLILEGGRLEEQRTLFE